MGICAPWAAEYGDEVCIPCEEGAGYDFDPVLYDQFLLAASEELYAFSGKQFPGVCTTTVVPCSRRFMREAVYSSTATFASQSAMYRAGWFQACSCWDTDRCSCTRLPSIMLPLRPAISIEEITIEGVLLDPADYELRGNSVVRLDGEGWPCCDIEITYTYGREVPIGGKQAAATIACEKYIDCYPDSFPDLSCRLPRNIASLSRQGVQVLFERLTNGRMKSFRYGIPSVDNWLESVNPYGVTGPSVVISPDTVPIARRVL